MPEDDRPLIWLKGEVKSPPFSFKARIETGFLLRRIQEGEHLTLPHSRPMPNIGPRCHELRVTDEMQTWRIIYRHDDDALLILEVFSKKTEETPDRVINNCKRRMKIYDSA